ncbi:hypothetical protein K2173_004894 [Erythroxylum novogranatense]|uniref:DUF4378 domain-containing protein n=1 Tax=Erythroxylum novogranatense TaxID=1862640 RepID=A0AAV8TCG4_9ROSI|nr:hypothetical protein K2173_004894 [Erythroxylum novogranatense]
MGGLFQLFDLNQDGMAKKISANKRHVDGLEAPRNSLELQVETCQHCSGAGNALYSYQVEEDCSVKNCYTVELSMKRFINKEISKQSNTRKNAPSIVTRLMGLDMLPPDTKSVVKPTDTWSENTQSSVSKKDKNEVLLTKNLSSKSKSYSQVDLNLLYPCEDRDVDRWDDRQKVGEPRSREHPQEEELKKFKKEFEARQAARFKECSKFLELDSISDHFPARHNINKPNVVNNSCFGQPGNQKSLEHKGFQVKGESHENFGFEHFKLRRELIPAEPKEYLSSRIHSLYYDYKLDSLSAPTRIVILKPGPYQICDYEDCSTNSSGILEDRGSMEGFLEEVKERLRYELQGNIPKRGSVVRGSGIGTPFSEKPSVPKEIAQDITKKVRKIVSREQGINLPRSDSMRSCTSGVDFNAPGSPEFINRDTRRFLSERPRNVLKRKTHLDAPVVVSSSSISSLLDDEKGRIKQVANILKTRNAMAYGEIMEDEQEIQTRSFRHEDGNSLLRRGSSPINLMRSLSTPVSGKSSRKPLLEDRLVLTGIHIRRKQESLENLTLDMRKRKKENFNIKEKVSNFRYSLTPRGRLFDKKMQSTAEFHGLERDLMKDIMSGPTVSMNLRERPIMENSTEVPPSPASVCSSPEDEFRWLADDTSPTSTPDRVEYNSVPRVFREISSDLNVLRRQLNQLESEELEDKTMAHKPVELMVDLEKKTEAYIRDLLVASGFYDGPSDHFLSPVGTPISNSVFQEVEESCEKKEKYKETILDKIVKIDHKLLFDLLNEALSTVLGPPITMSRFRRKIIGTSMLSHLCGRKLLDRAWETMCGYIYPPNDKPYYSLDSLEAKNLELIPWSSLVDDEVNASGKEMECLIMRDLIEETLKDMCV